ncbi:FAD-dependent oxidoreductase [Panacibacter sp. DH6]|uniref:FAD-dependent oxidoreductase n=1 Tax=Panacibacter microcysteis TaxID=2793269 RepID=A0A931E8L6_9BACT|nr:FAD-dependent oxidoreductase [Panacibacter microcysteis]MBG9377376.1 FAD-dependent oxidoreductase [Panacibacter microcysteis]
MKCIIFSIVTVLFAAGVFAQYDVCIYGGTSAGVIAAYTAARQNKKVILIEPGKHPGGLSSGGLGYTDIGNKYVVTGLARDFYRRLGKHYGKFETWIFEPHVAEQIFNDYIREANVPVLYGYRITGALKQNNAIQSITIENAFMPAAATNKTITAKMFIDCSYEGDLMAKAGVRYTVGREDNKTYNETWNGIQLLDKHQFPDGVDPYKIAGDSTSGLLWGISSNSLLPNGTGNAMVQTYNYRICLTNNAANRIDITAPAGYDPSNYELLLRYIAIFKPKELNDRVLKIDIMPNNKTDINNNGPFSTDYIGMNHAYPDADYKTRQQILKDQLLYTQGLLYFIGHDPRMPAHLRNEMLQWGYPKDEYTDNNNFTPQAYVRESRRMIGAYVMTQHNCEGREVITDGAGMAAYTMDSHNCQRLVVNGMVKNEGDVQVGGFGPYPVSYRALVPKPEECTNLLVPVCLSASHIAYGSIRMEPVFMVLAQSGAAAACMAIDNNTTVQQVDVKKLQALLAQNPLMDGSVAEILVDDNDAAHVKISGAHVVKQNGGYGTTWIMLPQAAQPASVVYTPSVQHAGNYAIYAYVPVAGQASTFLRYQLNNDKGTKITVRTPTKAEGQTSGEWVLLGTHYLPKGNNTSVTLTAKGADGTVAADALLFVPAK